MCPAIECMSMANIIVVGGNVSSSMSGVRGYWCGHVVVG